MTADHSAARQNSRPAIRERACFIVRCDNRPRRSFIPVTAVRLGDRSFDGAAA
ncbi:MAG TPA: hypothetical protein VHO06_18175 [Polyangia bacterium]|nr:hypothetical protein [Polyangia bacterium]